MNVIIDEDVKHMGKTWAADVSYTGTFSNFGRTPANIFLSKMKAKQHAWRGRWLAWALDVGFPANAGGGLQNFGE